MGTRKINPQWDPNLPKGTHISQMGPYLAEGTHVHRNVSPASVPSAQRVIMGRVAACASNGNSGLSGCISVVLQAFWGAGRQAG